MHLRKFKSFIIIVSKFALFSGRFFSQGGLVFFFFGSTFSYLDLDIFFKVLHIGYQETNLIFQENTGLCTIFGI